MNKRNQIRETIERKKPMDQYSEKEYTEYQKKVIRNFYENKDLRLIQKLGELVSDMYLETNGKKRESGWKKIQKMLADLKVHPNEIEFLTKDKNLSVISKKLAEMF
ncbi:MAG: hypothetical protein IT420_02530 [Candidatus Brocadia sp.]|nr:hypothetical protein [Candidatus Brocadia sp.]